MRLTENTNVKKKIDLASFSQKKQIFYFFWHCFCCAVSSETFSVMSRWKLLFCECLFGNPTQSTL